MTGRIPYFLKGFFRNEALKHKSRFHKNLGKLDGFFFSDIFPVKEKLSHRICVVCSQNKFDVVLKTPSNYQYMQCAGCKMVIMNPAPSEDALHILYNSGEMSLNASGSDISKPVSPTGKSYLNFIINHIRGGRLLDIGCGVGGFLMTASRYFETEGLEINKVHAAKGISEGLTIHNVYSKDFRPGATYDIITLNQVIEHLSDPTSVLQDVRRLLKNGGYFFLACPNFDSLSMKFFKSKHRHLSSFGHINMFTPSTLRSLMEREGFECVEISTYNLDIELHDIFFYYLMPGFFSHRHAAYNPFAYQFFRFLFWPFRKKLERRVVARNKGSYIQAIFRKK